MNFNKFDFNSIKVQLEPYVSGAKLVGLQFQFHKGTIRTLFPRCNNPVPVVFQFHKGTIRTDLSHRHMFTANVFQFHKGTIRTRKRN